MVSPAQQKAQKKYMDKIRHTDHFIMLSRGYSSKYSKKRYDTDPVHRAQKLKVANEYNYYKNDKDQILTAIRKLF